MASTIWLVETNWTDEVLVYIMMNGIEANFSAFRVNHTIIRNSTSQLDVCNGSNELGERKYTNEFECMYVAYLKLHNVYE